jgi:regulation of enolase protein 1 (concanavalin A-like superfamily)
MMNNLIDFSCFRWLNPPAQFKLDDGILSVTTSPGTDLWQRTYYGFRHNNAPAFLTPVTEKAFTFSARVTWKPQALFDQCGVILYQDEDNWLKASVEYENEQFSQLGSVVTSLGYSDWATTVIDTKVNSLFYRLSRRGEDFLLENSEDGLHFMQMRVLHMHQLIRQANIGVYACSPLDSSFQAVFSDFKIGECIWKAFT